MTAKYEGPRVSAKGNANLGFGLGLHSAYSSCCCSHINSHYQVHSHRTGSIHSTIEEYPRKKTTGKAKSGTRIYHS